MSDKFSYHRHLKTIAEKDVEYLLWKDRQYGASWKESGRSAWFMVRRMIDRLVNMMARPPEPTTIDSTLEAIKIGKVPTDLNTLQYMRDALLSEDLLAKVQAEGLEGQDGTVLAVLRDLRRYALLVEAEITERLTEKEKRVLPQIPTETLDGWPVPLEDSNKHAARQVMRDQPWRVDQTWREENKFHDEGRSIEFNTWWERRSPNLWCPMPFVSMQTSSLRPNVLRGLYVAVGTNDIAGHLLRIEQCPDGLRAGYPKFPEEVNRFELNQQPDWSHLLYDWLESEGKYRMKPEFIEWSRW
jgi:hypothetical protein